MLRRKVSPTIMQQLAARATVAAKPYIAQATVAVEPHIPPNIKSGFATMMAHTNKAHTAVASKMRSLPSIAETTDTLRGFSEAIKHSSAATGLSRALNATTVSETFNTTTMWCTAGALATLADREHYARISSSMHHVHAAIEGACDASSSPAVRTFWDRYGELRRAPALATDLKEVGAWPPAPPSGETMCYVRVIEEAARADEADGGGRLLGHVYACHLLDFAGAPDLLGRCSRRALGLGAGSPQRLAYDASIGGDAAGVSARLAAMEEIMVDLNVCGVMSLCDEDEVVAACRKGLAASANVLSETPGNVQKAAKVGALALTGLKRIVLGYREPKATTPVVTDGSTSSTAAAPTLAASAASVTSAAPQLNSPPAQPASSPAPAAAAEAPAAERTAWDAYTEEAARMRVLGGISLEGARPAQLRDHAASIKAGRGVGRGGFGVHEVTSLVAGLDELAGRLEALGEAEAAAAKALDARRTWLLSPAAASNQANLADFIAACKADQLRNDGPHDVLHRDATQEEGEAAASSAAKEKEAASALVAAISAGEQPRHYPYCIVPWDSRGLDGGSMSACLERAERHLAELTHEMEAARSYKAGLESARSNARAAVGAQQQRLSKEIFSELHASSQATLRAELARFP